MPLTPYLEKAMLDWALGGASAPTIANRYFQFATSAPDANNDYPGPFTNRMTLQMAVASTAGGGSASVTNANVLVRTATAIATMVGWNIYDQLGNRLMYGTLTAGIACGSGDGCRLTAGSLIITLA